MATQFISQSQDVRPDFEDMEDVLVSMVTGVEPFKVEKFPDNWRNYVEKKLVNCDGAILTAIRQITRSKKATGGTAWSFITDFVIVFKSYRDTEAHTKGWSLIGKVCDSVDDKLFNFDGEQYTSLVTEAVHVTNVNEYWVWVVRANVRPTLALD